MATLAPATYRRTGPHLLGKRGRRTSTVLRKNSMAGRRTSMRRLRRCAVRRIREINRGAAFAISRAIRTRRTFTLTIDGWGTTQAQAILTII